jgi:hypothetical protein
MQKNSKVLVKKGINLACFCLIIKQIWCLKIKFLTLFLWTRYRGTEFAPPLRMGKETMIKQKHDFDVDYFKVIVSIKLAKV